MIHVVPSRFDTLTLMTAVGPRPERGLPPDSDPPIPVGSPSCAMIDVDAIVDNVRALRSFAPNSELMAVVKADGYGHGMVPVAAAALRGGARWLGVAQLAEGLALRAAGITAPVLAWLAVPGDAFAEAITAGIDLGVGSRWSLEEIADAARVLGVPARVHLKIDSGMSRNGITPAQWPDLVDLVAKLSAEGTIEVVGAMSHLAVSDIPGHPTVRRQREIFLDAVAVAERYGLRIELRHLANSAATLLDAASHLEMVRPGLAIYGLNPVTGRTTPADFGLRPAMSLYGRVALVKEVPAGSGVSYGHTYVTERDTTLAVIPLGYADGIPRHASNRGPISVRGHTFSVAGRVCMDQVVLDLGPGNPRHIAPGDPALVFGDGTDDGPTAQDWAEAAGTINYEIVTGIGTRVPRRYRGGGSGEGQRFSDEGNDHS
jgi:alanine racemase